MRRETHQWDWWKLGVWLFGLGFSVALWVMAGLTLARFS